MGGNKRTDKLSTIWKQDPHTQAKHELLVRYLGAWLPIMGRTRRRAVVLDMFAGPGRYEGGQPGSPVLVLDRILTHDDFKAGQWNRCEFVLLFNEMDSKRHAALEEILSDYVVEHQPWPHNVRLHEPLSKPFQELARELLDGLKGSQMAPAFVFLDPFGIKGVPLALIGELVSSSACDMLLYFGIDTVNRFATAKNVDQHLEELFGTADYRDAPTGDGRLAFLHDLYEQQLRAVCKFSHVQSFAMVNQQGHIGNYMFFCTRNSQAFDKMKEAMWKLSPTGDYRFEDRFVGMDVLFDKEEATRPLQTALLSHFAGQETPIETVIEWVINETPFHSGQVKKNTLAVMQREGVISAMNQRKKNTFPPGTVVVFP